MLKKQAEIKLKKQAFMQGQTSFDSDISLEIQESWIRSKSFKLDPHTEQVPSWANDKDTLKNISGLTKEMRMKFTEIYDRQHDLLAQAGSAILYIDNNHSVFAKGGNADLLNELKRKNIKFSTNFSEKNLGTTAASIATHHKKNAWVIGEEHYMDLLTPYACYTSFYTRPESSSPHFQQNEFLSLVIIPIQKLTPLTVKLIEYLTLSKNYIVNQIYQSGSYLKDHLLEKSLQTNKTALVIANKNDIILDVNHQFCESFNVTKDNVCGSLITTIIPQIKTLIAKAHQGEQTLFHTAIFSHLPSDHNEFYIDCLPTMQDGKLLGLSLMLTSNKDIRSYLGNFVNQDAYFTFNSLIGQSENFRQMKQTAHQAAKSVSNILICGESGTGKELFAQAIHNASPRKDHPFIAINCAAIPKELIGSELFGYVEGAFTGAKKSGSMGKFEQANKGTLFLDEIAEMPLDMQSILLRVIEDRKVTRLGGEQSYNMDVRIIAATNRNLHDYVQEEKFRLDLYYRLNVIRLDLIPLRERRSDIPLLAQYYLSSFNQALGKNITGLTKEAMDCLYAYDWPGNARELRNVLERCCNLEQKSVISIESLPSDLYTPNISSENTPLIKTITNNSEIPPSQNTYANYEEMEQNQLKELMKKHKGNKSLVAQELGMARSTLYRKLDKISKWS